jgi:hypothetical protein
MLSTWTSSGSVRPVRGAQRASTVQLYVPCALHPCAVAASFVAKQFRPSDIIRALCLHRKPSSCLLRKELGRGKEMGTICLVRAGKMGLKKSLSGLHYRKLHNKEVQRQRHFPRTASESPSVSATTPEPAHFNSCQSHLSHNMSMPILTCRWQR